ncbi:putative RNA helicase armi isoform 1-T2 [Glossina fuscipes fuscipes]
MTVKLYRKNIKLESIGIITPYIKQAEHLRDLFDVADVAASKIGSAEQFQGQERDIILLSTVRSNENYIKTDLRLGQGFIEHEKRVNLAITRARSLVIIYGNPFLLIEHDRSKRCA